MGKAKLPPSSIWDDLRFASLDLNSMPMGPLRPMSTCSPGPLTQFRLSLLSTRACLGQVWSPGTATLAPPGHWFLATWLAIINSPGLEQGSRYTAGVQQMFAGCVGGCSPGVWVNAHSHPSLITTQPWFLLFKSLALILERAHWADVKVRQGRECLPGS